MGYTEEILEVVCVRHTGYSPYGQLSWRTVLRGNAPQTPIIWNKKVKHWQYAGACFCTVHKDCLWIVQRWNMYKNNGLVLARKCGNGTSTQYQLCHSPYSFLKECTKWFMCSATLASQCTAKCLPFRLPLACTDGVVYMDCYVLFFNILWRKTKNFLKIGAKCTTTTPYVIIRVDEVSAVNRGHLFCFFERHGEQSANQKVQPCLLIYGIVYA